MWIQGAIFSAVSYEFSQHFRPLDKNYDTDRPDSFPVGFGERWNGIIASAQNAADNNSPTFHSIWFNLIQSNLWMYNDNAQRIFFSTAIAANDKPL